MTRAVSGGEKLSEEDEAERRRLGREYLARRNQELLDAREKATMRTSAASLASSSANIETTPVTMEPASLIDENSTALLRDITSEKSESYAVGETLVQSETLDDEEAGQDEKTLDLPSPPTGEPVSTQDRETAILEASGSSEPYRAYNTGACWANPFSDEFELEDTGYLTPRPQAPAVPPKIALDPEISITEPPMDAPVTSVSNKGKQPESTVKQIPIQQDDTPENYENMSYEEQLARVLSLSLADDKRNKKGRYLEKGPKDDEDSELAAAIAASLAEAQTATQSKQKHPETTQLVDLTPDPPVSVPQSQSSEVTNQQPLSSQSTRSDWDDLYSLSPEFQASRAARGVSPFNLSGLPNNCSIDEARGEKPGDDSSLIDISISGIVNDSVKNTASNAEAHSPALEHFTTIATLSPSVERDSIGFATDSEADDEFASAAGSFVDTSRPASTASFVTDADHAARDDAETTSLVGHSDAESASLVNLNEGYQHGERKIGGMDGENGQDEEEDSDEEWGSGIKTPGSEWTDVGSQISEEEIGGQDSSRLIRE